MSKRKNNIKDQKQIILIGFALASLALLFVSILLISPLLFQREPDAFNQTAIPFMPNPTVAALIAQTQVAATEQFMMTSTLETATLLP